MNAATAITQVAETHRDILRRVGKVAAYAILAAFAGILLLVAVATIPVLFGYHTYNVNGGSMGPSLASGSTAVTKPTSPQLLRVGDIIAYRSDPDSPHVLHRIVEIRTIDGERLFVTQGDRNETPDPIPVALGGPGDKVVYSVPYAGYILSFARSPIGLIALIGVPLASLAFFYIRETSHWPRPAQNEPSRTGERVAPEDPLQPAARPVSLVVSAIPDFPALMETLRGVEGLTAAESAAVASFREGSAHIEIVLLAPVSAHEIAAALEQSTGYQMSIEPSQPAMGLRLRFAAEAAWEEQRVA